MVNFLSDIDTYLLQKRSHADTATLRPSDDQLTPLMGEALPQNGWAESRYSINSTGFRIGIIFLLVIMN